MRSRQCVQCGWLLGERRAAVWESQRPECWPARTRDRRRVQMRLARWSRCVLVMGQVETGTAAAGTPHGRVVRYEVPLRLRLLQYAF